MGRHWSFFLIAYFYFLSFCFFLCFIFLGFLILRAINSSCESFSHRYKVFISVKYALLNRQIALENINARLTHSCSSKVQARFLYSCFAHIFFQLICFYLVNFCLIFYLILWVKIISLKIMFICVEVVLLVSFLIYFIHIVVTLWLIFSTFFA